MAAEKSAVDRNARAYSTHMSIGMLVRVYFWEIIMPCFSESNVLEKMERIREAKRRVRSNFPKLIEGSSGWFRAVAHQVKKVRI
jgi:hypothetical protein